MDYKKKYEEALERARDVYTYYCDDREQLRKIESIFPELKESEGERIGKQLLNWFKGCHWDSIDDGRLKRDDIIAWLEKQGKTSLILSNSSNIEKNEQKATDVEPKIKVKYAGSEYNVFETKDIAGVTFYGIEDEPNHIDYVKAENCEIISSGYGIKENGSPYPTKSATFFEPKFKVGDWVVQGCNILRIRCLGVERYCYETVGGYVDDMLVSEMDSLYHLWTINDARDGDVLALNNEVFIYAHRKQTYSIAVAHCYVDSGGGFYLDGEFGYRERGETIFPATKEQRDTLWSAMKEADYKWDSDNKKVTKI